MTVIFGSDPGRDKCGIAVLEERHLHYYQVVPSGKAIATFQTLHQQYSPTILVMGDQTTAKTWKKQLNAALPSLEIVMVDERYSSLEARDRYWQMYPPQGLQRLIPQGLREPPRPIDDLVAILLIERYLELGSRGN